MDKESTLAIRGGESAVEIAKLIKEHDSHGRVIYLHHRSPSR